MIKNGTRLQSQVCDTQVIVVRSADSLDDLRAGGVPMVPLDAQKDSAATIDAAFSDGNLMGKRYVDDAGACHEPIPTTIPFTPAGHDGPVELATEVVATPPTDPAG